MKHKLTVIMAMVLIASWTYAELLIGWDKGVGTNYSYAVSGISGNLFNAKSAGAKTDGTSTDGTFGSAFSGADTSVNWAMGIGSNSTVGAENNTIGIKIDNNTGSNLVLNALHFDTQRIFAGASSTITVKFGYGTDTTVLAGVAYGSTVATLDVPVSAGKIANYTDWDVSLTGLADFTVENGKSVTFQLVGSGATTGTLLYLDNFAYSGTFEAIPEPATLGLVTIIGAALFGIRRIMTL